MSTEDILAAIALSLLFGSWLGILADSWKGRNVYLWTLIGICTNFVGIIILAFVPTRKKFKTT